MMNGRIDYVFECERVPGGLAEVELWQKLLGTWLRAACPTKGNPSSANAIADGVVRLPSEFSITVTPDRLEIATQEFVVPRSIPMMSSLTARVISLFEELKNVRGVELHAHLRVQGCRNFLKNILLYRECKLQKKNEKKKKLTLNQLWIFWIWFWGD